MKLSCPACGSVASLDVLLGHEGARDAVMAALAMPAPIGKIMVQYLGLFRPAQRNLSMDRLANLINELLPMIAEAKIERHGRIWGAPQEYWKMAMEDMLIKRDKLTLPLKNTATCSPSSKDIAARPKPKPRLKPKRVSPGIRL